MEHPQLGHQEVKNDELAGSVEPFLVICGLKSAQISKTRMMNRAILWGEQLHGSLLRQHFLFMQAIDCKL